MFGDTGLQGAKKTMEEYYFDTHDALEEEKEQEEQVQQENAINSSLLLGTNLLDKDASYLVDVSGDSLLLGDQESLLTPPASTTRIYTTDTGSLVGAGEPPATASTNEIPNQGAGKSNVRDSSNDHDDEIITTQQTPQKQPQESTINLVSEPVTATPAATATTLRSRSIVTGQLLSPFSPLLKQQQQRAKANSSTIIGDVAFTSDDDLSLQPCRKISTIAHICYHSNVATVDTNDANTINTNSPSVFTFDDEATATTTTTGDSKSPKKRPTIPREKRLCLFPMMTEDSTFSTSSTTDYKSPTASIAAPNSSCLSPTSATLQLASTQNTRDLVVVNPSAFGKYIPSEITMRK